MTTVISPSLGQNIDFVQQGPGASPGYSAIDVRRAAQLGLLPGCIGSAYSGSASSGAYAVTQRTLGANMSVDIAASTGGGILVAGTTVGNQGLYFVPPHSALINETISTADATNPRVDQLIVETFDNAVDSSGLNTSRTRVLTGTPTSGATIGIAGNRNGAAALSANAYRLADVLVPAGAASITNANIFDRRPKTRGHCNVSATESRTNTAYGTMPTPDQVTEIVLPQDGVMFVAYQATWNESVSGAAAAAIFLNGNQLKVASNAGVVPEVQAGITNAGGTGPYPITTFPLGLASGKGGYTGDVGTGQALAINNAAGISYAIGGATLTAAAALFGGGPCTIVAAAGTYHVSVQFKASSGNVTATSRKLQVWTKALDQAVLA